MKAIIRDTLNTIILEFAKNGRLFESEAQFQFDLAWKLQEVLGDDSKIYLEKRLGAGKRKYTDIVIECHGAIIAIEVKNKFADKEVTYTKNGVKVVIPAQGAADEGCFDFLNDISRIEELKKNKSIDFGFAIMLTNYPLYWGDGVKDNSKWSQYCLWNGRSKSGVFYWYGKSKKEDISLSRTYGITWQDYEPGYSEEMPSARCKKHPFKFLIVEI